MNILRRKFIRNIGLTGLTLTSLPSAISAINHREHILKQNTSKGLTILFQGDSITDGNRSRDKDWNHVMGHGYAYLIASRLWFDYQDNDLMFYNRGVSGDKVLDLSARWQKDTLDLSPDILSVLVGVNDIPLIIANEYSIEKWEETYSQILDRTKETLPNTIIVLCEPFILPSDDIVRITWTQEKTSSYQNVISKMQLVVRGLAEKYDAIFVGLQQPFLDASKKSPPPYWVWDGIHPMPAGHELIARLWIKEVGEKLDL